MVDAAVRDQGEVVEHRRRPLDEATTLAALPCSSRSVARSLASSGACTATLSGTRSAVRRFCPCSLGRPRSRRSTPRGARRARPLGPRPFLRAAILPSGNTRPSAPTHSWPFGAQSRSPHARCLRFAVTVTRLLANDRARLASGWGVSCRTGLEPAGSLRVTAVPAAPWGAQWSSFS